jgi:hypothetical protein
MIFSFVLIYDFLRMIDISRKKFIAGKSFLGFGTAGSPAVRQHKVASGNILLLVHRWCARGKAYCLRTSRFTSSIILPLAHHWCASRTTLLLEHHRGALGIMLVGPRPGATLVPALDYPWRTTWCASSI